MENYFDVALGWLRGYEPSVLAATVVFVVGWTVAKALHGNYALAFMCLAGVFLSACEVSKPEAETPAEVSSAASALSLAELEERVADNPLKDAYFGETHVHTSF